LHAAEYEQPSDATALAATGVECLVFNFTGLPGFTYKGRKPIRKQVTMTFTVDSRTELQEAKIFDFGVNGLDMFYFADPDLVPGAAFHLANSTEPTTFTYLNSRGVPFVVRGPVFDVAYEDTNIVGTSSVTQLSLARVETTTADDRQPVVSHVVHSVSADLFSKELEAKFGELPKPTPSSRLSFAALVMTFTGPEITEYMYAPPQVGALLGQLGGLKGLTVDLWLLAIVVVVYLDAVLDRGGQHNVNHGKFRTVNVVVQQRD